MYYIREIKMFTKKVFKYRYKMQSKTGHVLPRFMKYIYTRVRAHIDTDTCVTRSMLREGG